MRPVKRQWWRFWDPAILWVKGALPVSLFVWRPRPRLHRPPHSLLKNTEMIRALHGQHEFSDRFIAYMIARNIRVEEDLIDQLFNSSEKRLARALLLLARYGEQGWPQKMLSEVSQEMLAEMIGTTRPRVNFFMNKFRKLGFIKYGGRLRRLQINESLLSVVLQD